MASVVTKEGEYYPFYLSDVGDVSKKIMVAEEQRASIDDGRWVPSAPSLNRLSARHGNQADVGFGDGHVDSVSPDFGNFARNSHPALY